jgi:membrane protease subunit HflC
MKKYILLPLAVVAAFVLARLSLYTVDAAEYAYVTLLGKRIAIHDGGAADDGAGLKVGFPWPVQQVQRLERRIQIFDLPPMEQLTYDRESKAIDKLLLVEGYVCWQIAGRDSVPRFVEQIGTVQNARKILGDRINSDLGAAIGRLRMDDFAIDAKTGEILIDQTVRNLRDKLLTDLSDDVLHKYGIQLIDIRLRRFNHPASVRESIFARIRAERAKEANKYVVEGATKATIILSKADQEVREALARARTEEERIKAEADIDAMKVRNQAYSQDREFYTFLKNMEVMQSVLGSQKTMLLLSTHREMFNAMFAPPGSKIETPKQEKKGGS